MLFTGYFNEALQSTKGGAVEAENLTASSPSHPDSSIEPTSDRYDNRETAGFTHWVTEVDRWITVSLFRSAVHHFFHGADEAQERTELWAEEKLHLFL